MIFEFFPSVTLLARLHIFTAALLVSADIRTHIPLLADLSFVFFVSRISPEVLDIVTVLTTTLIMWMVEWTVHSFVFVQIKL